VQRHNLRRIYDYLATIGPVQHQQVQCRSKGKTHRIAGRKIYSPSNNTATNAKYTFDAENGAIGGNGKIESSHKNITTTNRISKIMVRLRS
jgi:hypothetical protein